MCQNLSEISPFVLEIIQGGINDSNAYVKQIAMISLIKLFENTDISFDDYEEEIQTNIFQKILVEQTIINDIDIEIFQTCL